MTDPTPGLVLHRHHHHGWKVYGGRPSVWGNPFIFKQSRVADVIIVTDLAAALAAYQAWLDDDQTTLDRYLPAEQQGSIPFPLQRQAVYDRWHEIHGQKVACFCVTEPTLPDTEPVVCHLQLLLRYAHKRSLECPHKNSAILSAANLTQVTSSP